MKQHLVWEESIVKITFTGRFERFTPLFMRHVAKEKGYKVSENISKTTTLLVVAPRNYSQKQIDFARLNSIEIIDEAAFARRFG